MCNKIFITIIFTLAFLTQVNAQKDSLIKGTNIDVVKTFKPILSEAIKIPINPNPETPEIKPTFFSYNLPTLKLNVEPTLYTIKPLSVGTALLPKLSGNYFKLGYGNYNMPLAEVYLNTTRNKNRQAGIFYKHLSAGGDNDYNNFSNNTIYGYTKEIKGRNVYALNTYYHRNKVNLYGFPNDIAVKPSEDSTKNLYNLFDINGSYTLMPKDTQDFNFKLGASYYYYNSNRNIAENDIKVYAEINKIYLDIPFVMPVIINYNTTNFIDKLYQRTFVTLKPEITLKDNDFYIKAGFNVTYFSDTSGGKFHFFPKAEAGFFVIPKKLTVLAGITGNLNQNTFRSITTENPFATNIQLMNTVNKFEIYGSIRGQLSAKSSFLLTSSSSKITNQLFYGFDSITNAQTTLYDEGKSSGSLVKLGFAVDYSVNSQFLLALSGNLYNYKLVKLAKPYSRPGFDFKLNASYNMADKFVFRYDMFFINQRFGLIEPTNAEIKLDPFVDFNFGIDYRYNKNVSAFLNFNNIANNRYQVWLNYPVYGFNIMGGLTFTF